MAPVLASRRYWKARDGSDIITLTVEDGVFAPTNLNTFVANMKWIIFFLGSSFPSFAPPLGGLVRHGHEDTIGKVSFHARILRLC